MTICLLLSVVGVQADKWAPGDVQHQYQNDKPFLVKVTVTGASMNVPPQLELAAFIGQSCRAQATTKTNGRYELRVWGDPSELGETVTFKVCYKDLVYQFKQTATFALNGNDANTETIDLILDPLTGVTLDNPISIIPVALPIENYDLLQHVTLQYASGATSENTILEDNQLDYVWDIHNSTVFSVTNNALTSIDQNETSPDGDDLTLTISVANPEPGNLNYFSAEATTKVIVQKAVIPVTGITLTPSSITAHVGDDIFTALNAVNVKVAPDNASNQATTWDFQNGEEEWVSATNGQVTTPGTWHIIYSSVSNPEITATLTVTVPVPVSFTVPSPVTLSLLEDTEVTFMNLVGDDFDPNKVSVTTDPLQNGDTPFNAIYVSHDNGQMTWTFRGKYAGSYIFRVLYDGEPMLTASSDPTATADIEGKLVLPKDGWDWISVNYVPAGGTSFALNNYQETFDKVTEIRSQDALLYNDAQLGLFGDLTAMSPSDGMYKVRGSFGNETTNIINFGATAASATAVAPKAVVKGYNWITYPNEFDLTLAELQAQLSTNATDGDLIIGRAGTITYDGTEKKWVGTLTFEAGKGYIYYTTNENPAAPDFSFNAIPACYQQGGNVKGLVPTQANVWDVNNKDFADVMPVIASVKGLQNPNNYVIGAFVGDECRGQGECAVRDILILNVAGVAGEQITFRLFNKFTGEFTDINEEIRYTSMVGSLRAPLQLSTPSATGIGEVKNGQWTTDENAMYDLGGRRVSKPAKSGIYIQNGRKFVVK